VALDAIPHVRHKTTLKTNMWYNILCHLSNCLKYKQNVQHRSGVTNSNCSEGQMRTYL